MKYYITLNGSTAELPNGKDAPSTTYEEAKANFFDLILALTQGESAAYITLFRHGAAGERLGALVTHHGGGDAVDMMEDQ